MEYKDLPMKDGEIDPKKIDLVKFPVTFTFKTPLLGTDIAKSDFREPTMGNLIEANKETSDHEKNLKLLSLIVENLKPEQVRDIVPHDYYKLLAIITPFLV